MRGEPDGDSTAYRTGYDTDVSILLYDLSREYSVLLNAIDALAEGHPSLAAPCLQTFGRHHTPYNVIECPDSHQNKGPETRFCIICRVVVQLRSASAPL